MKNVEYFSSMLNNVAFFIVFSSFRVSSTVLKGCISAITHGVSRHQDEVLIASTDVGKIAVWNLTLFKINLLELPLDSTFNSSHHPDSPGILCLSFHLRSGCLISGGLDGSVNLQRLKMDVTPHRLDYHMGYSVWSICCTDKFLATGDEVGRCVLWLIRQRSKANRRATLEEQRAALNAFPLEVVPLCVWGCAIQGSYQCIGIEQIFVHDTNTMHAFVGITKNFSKSSHVWRVSVSDISTKFLDKKNTQRLFHEEDASLMSLATSLGVDLDFADENIIENRAMERKPSAGLGHLLGSARKSSVSSNVSCQVEPETNHNNNDAASASALLASRTLGNVVKQNDMANELGNGYKKNNGEDGGLPAHVHANVNPSDMLDFFPLPSEFQNYKVSCITVGVAQHDNLEPSCMELRIVNKEDLGSKETYSSFSNSVNRTKNDISTAINNVHQRGNSISEPMANMRSVAPSQSSINRCGVVLYLGMSNGLINKYKFS